MAQIYTHEQDCRIVEEVEEGAVHPIGCLPPCRYNGFGKGKRASSCRRELNGFVRNDSVQTSRCLALVFDEPSVSAALASL